VNLRKDRVVEMYVGLCVEYLEFLVVAVTFGSVFASVRFALFRPVKGRGYRSLLHVWSGSVLGVHSIMEHID
jgi:hypothetical protein